MSSRLCANCRNPGHTINHCTDQIVEILLQDSSNVANYSIGYNYPQLIKVWFDNMSINRLRVLAYRNNIPMDRQSIAAARTTLKKYLITQLTNFYNPNPNPTPPTPAQTAAAIEALTAIPGAQERVIEIINHYIQQGRLIRFAEVRISQRRQHSIHERIRLTEERQNNLEEILRNAQEELELVIRNRNAIEQELIREMEVERAEMAQSFNRPHERSVIDSRMRRRRSFIQENDELIHFLADIGVVITAPPPNPPPRKFDISTSLIKAITATTTATTTPTIDCPICYDKIAHENVVTTNCSHQYCAPCLTGSFDNVQAHQTKMPICALCREPTKSLKFNCAEIRKTFQTKYLAREEEEEAVEEEEEEEEEEEVTWEINRLPILSAVL